MKDKLLLAFHFAFDQRIHIGVGRHAFFFQPLAQRHAGFAVGTEGDFRRHQFLGFAAVFAARRHAVDFDGEPARCRVDFTRCIDGHQSAGCQPGGDALCKRIGELFECFRRQFFGQQFDQQVGAHAVAFSCAAAFSAATSMPSRSSCPGAHIGKSCRRRESK